MIPCNQFKYVLVVVDMFSKWVEVYPCRRFDTTSVVKHLVTDFVCRFGIPCRISSEQGTHFMAELTKEMCKALQIKQTFHCAYHPQSAGVVERENGTLKNHLQKICDDTG